MSHTKPDFVVFYAWQSDRPGNSNRYFIQEAAVDAAALLNAEPDCPYLIRIDQDTQDVPGLCDIPATILTKIDAADALLCDLTYIATTRPDNESDAPADVRHCSNPNVLFELGYAFRAIGPERVLCVMNEHYGPVANQIFDLAHRRHPLPYTFPDIQRTRKDVKSDLTKRLAAAIRGLIPLGRRADAKDPGRISRIRSDFENRLRTSNYYDMVRRAGAIAVTIVPAFAMQIPYATLNTLTLPPPRDNGWSPTNRGDSIVSLDKQDGKLCSIAEMRTDGTILAADTWVLDPAFHPPKDRFVPSTRTEKTIIDSTKTYLGLLQQVNAPLPWTVCASLLEIKGYCFLGHNSDSSDAFPDTDIIAPAVQVTSLNAPFDQQNVATILKPILDYMWREFAYDRCMHFAESGAYSA